MQDTSPPYCCPLQLSTVLSIFSMSSRFFLLPIQNNVSLQWSRSFAWNTDIEIFWDVSLIFENTRVWQKNKWLQLLAAVHIIGDVPKTNMAGKHEHLRFLQCIEDRAVYPQCDITPEHREVQCTCSLVWKNRMWKKDFTRRCLFGFQSKYDPCVQGFDARIEIYLFSSDAGR